MIGCRPTYLPVTERLLGSHDFLCQGNSYCSAYLKIAEAAEFVSDKCPFARAVAYVARTVIMNALVFVKVPYFVVVKAE